MFLFLLLPVFLWYGSSTGLAGPPSGVFGVHPQVSRMHVWVSSPNSRQAASSYDIRRHCKVDMGTPMTVLAEMLTIEIDRTKFQETIKEHSL